MTIPYDTEQIKILASLPPWMLFRIAEAAGEDSLADQALAALTVDLDGVCLTCRGEGVVSMGWHCKVPWHECCDACERVCPDCGGTE